MSFPKQATLLLHLCNAYQELLDDMFTSQFQLNIPAVLGPGLKAVQDRFTLNNTYLPMFTLYTSNTNLYMIHKNMLFETFY